MLRLLNLALLILFPISWFAPLMRAGLLPIFGLSEISIISGLASLFQTDVVLALIVLLFALFAPIAKTLGLALIHFDLLDRKTLPALTFLGKLAMADIFLIALYYRRQRRGPRHCGNRLGPLPLHRLRPRVPR